MSRIDEVLRRAEGEAVELSDDPAAVDEVETGVLERYAAERGPATVQKLHRERPHPVPSPRPAATPRTGAVPRVPALRGKLVTTAEIDPVSLEQYRRLAASLHDLQSQRSLKSLMVTSALPREGKTLTITNLALTLSESYQRRVLLIDADFRRPSVHELFGLPSVAGLVEALRTGDAQPHVVELTSTLSVLPAGRLEGSPVALLSSEAMRAIVDEAASRFDWVLLDTPPVALLTDAHLVARLVDGVVLVIAAGATPYPLVQRSIAELDPDRILGTVLNRIEIQALPVGGYYGHYYGGRR